MMAATVMKRTWSTLPAFHLLVTWSCLFNSATGNLLVVTDGNYSVGPYDHDYWLKSGPFFLHHNGHKLDTDNGTLKMDRGDFVHSGIDKLGRWQDDMWIFRTPDNFTMETRVRTYPLGEPNIVIFSQTFPMGLKRSSAANANWTATGFPTFRMQEGVTNTSLAYLMFAGYMMGDRSKIYGRWTPATPDIRGGLDGSGPLVLFDREGGVMIISVMDHSMAASVWLDDDVLAWGVMGGVDDLPPGYSMQTLLYMGNGGVGQAFREWGRILREWHGKTDDIVKYHQSQDVTLTHLGYWTDNGAYYYYNTETGKNYEQTLPDVMKYASQQKLPYRYVQIDSWWYPKDALRAVTTWDAMPSIFPHGLRNLSATLQVPIAAHNRYWSVNTTYAKQNGGQFDFFIGKQLSLPTGQDFWDWLMKTSSEWGLRLYEQDWLNVQVLGTEILQTNATAGADWLDSMARAARDHNMTVQYCMSQSRHALHSLLWPEVTQVRVTDDYHLYAENWKIGVTSHFAAALGLAPSKDTFWTSGTEAGNPFNKTEPYPELQSAVATLSTGPVGPGDAINLTDRDTLIRCCAADGLILKPSRPATAIDAMFLEMGFGEGEGTSGEVWSTYTDFGDFMRFGIVFAANVSRPFNITPTNVGFSPMIPQFPESRVFVRNIPDKVYNFNEATPFDIGPDTCNTAVAPHFCLFYTAPVLRLSGKEVIVLGELEKWVPMSARRVLSIRLTSTALTLTLGGQPGERIAFSYLLDQHLVNVTVRPDSAGCAAVHIQPTPATTAATTTNTTTVDETTTEQWHYSTSDASAPATEPSSSHSVVKTTENLSAASAGAGTRQSPVSPSAAHALQNSVSFKAAPSSSLGKSPASSSTGEVRRRRSPVAASSEPLGGNEFVRVFGTAPEKSCRFVPPPFTPPPPSPSATTPTTTATTPSTSSKHTSSPGPGGGASRLRLSVVIISVTLIGHILKL